jgi:hypothetical protein
MPEVTAWVGKHLAVRESVHKIGLISWGINEGTAEENYERTGEVRLNLSIRARPSPSLRRGRCVGEIVVLFVVRKSHGVEIEFLVASLC